MSLEQSYEDLSLDQVQLIDMDTGTIQEILDQTRNQLATLGFLAIKISPAQQELVQQAYAGANTFFDMPADQKAHYAHEKLEQGEFGIRGYFTNLDDATRSGGGKEHLNIDYHMLINDKHWKEFHESMAWHDARALRVGDYALHALQLPTPEAFMPRRASSSIMRAIRYHPDEAESNIFMDLHTDLNTVTLHSPSTTPGLRYTTPDGKVVQPDSGFAGRAVFAHFGTSMSDYSNGRVAATPHYVADTAGEPRTSVVFFSHAYPTAAETWVDASGMLQSNNTARWGDRLPRYPRSS